MKQCTGSIDSKNYPLSGVMVPANFGHEGPSCAQRYHVFGTWKCHCTSEHVMAADIFTTEKQHPNQKEIGFIFIGL